MECNANLKINKKSFSPSDLYYDTIREFIDESIDSSAYETILDDYDRLPKMATLEQITGMFSRGLSKSSVGNLNLVKVLMTHSNISLFYEGDDDIDEFVLDIDTYNNDDYELSLY